MSVSRPCRARCPPVCVTASARRLRTLQRAADVVRYGARQLALVTIIDIAVFFAVLLVGFAYVWNRGDLNWVRAYTRRDDAGSRPDAERETLDLEQALSA